MFQQRAQADSQKDVARSIYSTLFFLLFLFATSECLAEQLLPLTIERPPKQTIILTQGFSTTIHSERPFGKISITNPDVVDLVLRTDESAVLIPGVLDRRMSTFSTTTEA
jgi:Flp pilus assembly secretin CpaC